MKYLGIALTQQVERSKNRETSVRETEGDKNHGEREPRARGAEELVSSDDSRHLQVQRGAAERRSPVPEATEPTEGRLPHSLSGFIFHGSSF